MAMTDCRRHLLSSWGRRRRLSEYFLRRPDRQSGQSCLRDALPKILQIVPIFVVAYSSQIRRRPGLRKASIHFPSKPKKLGDCQETASLRSTTSHSPTLEVEAN
jgi:hypothetical protein